MSKLVLKSSASMSLATRFAELNREYQRKPRLHIGDEESDGEDDSLPTPQLHMPLQRQQKRKGSPLRDENSSASLPRRGTKVQKLQQTSNARYLDTQDVKPLFRQSENIGKMTSRDDEHDNNIGARDGIHRTARGRGNVQAPGTNTQTRHKGVVNRGRSPQEMREYQRELARQKKLRYENESRQQKIKQPQENFVKKPERKVGAIARLQAANSSKKLPSTLRKVTPAVASSAGKSGGLAGRIERQPLSSRLGARPEIQRLAKAAAAGRLGVLTAQPTSTTTKAMTNSKKGKSQPQRPKPKGVQPAKSTQPSNVSSRQRAHKPKASKEDLDRDLEKFMATAKLGDAEVVWDM
eukprot:CFRG5939T1